MTSKTKAIISPHGTVSLSQTVDSKDLSNPLKAVGLLKIQFTQGYNISFHKWIIKNVSDFEIVVENGYNDVNPWGVIKKYYPENWYFTPKDFSKSQEYYHSILEDTESVKLKHNFDKNDKNIIAYSSIQIKRVIHPKDWPTPNWYTDLTFKTLKKHFTSYNYFDYIDAWKNVFNIQNSNLTHSWLIYFDQSKIKETTRFSNWFLKWWQYRGISEEILSSEVSQVYQYFKSNYKPNLNESYIPPLKYFCINFFIPWIYQWFFDFQYMVGTSIPAIEWILKKAQFPTVSYAGKLILQQGEPSFGAQKAQCQALLAAAKTPEEFKIICQQMFNQLTLEEKEKVNQSFDKESSKESSSKQKKASSRRKIKKESSLESESTASSQTSSSSKN
ncbi:hypothetical protein MANES_15G177512v8 [Manihot esculenta]|uniref:Uncharacterized protein n=1 Tax=Manihot esculenta TaxID=3983 RepID=A0ACB7GE26_MANES|nr:hypothetical protein MANES_15G177512v8 [Manihot esculenta]